MMYQRGFLTPRRAILAQPFQGRAQIGHFCVEKAFHGPTMLQPLLLKLDNFCCGAANTLIELRS